MPVDRTYESPAGSNMAQKLGHFDNRELSTIAVLAALHFAVSYAARLFGYVLYMFLGPLAVFIDGIGGETLPSLLLAVTVTLIPRVGTAGLTIATVWLLNAVVTGTISLISLEMVGISIVVHELVLGTLGVTLENRLARPLRELPWTLVVRTGLAIGLANGAALYIQFYLNWEQLRQFFDLWYVHAVALVTGVGYGGLGAMIGTVWGFRLRRAAP
jgi:hypothetical protein